MEPQGGHTTSESVSHREWIPLLLRTRALLPLAVFPFGMIAALEVLRHLTVTRVLSSRDETLLNLTRYMPTLGVIVIGFIFKGIASDLKRVTVLLDYIYGLDIVDLFAPRNTTATFTQASSFDFESHPLALSNGSLKTLWNSPGAQPYARAISEHLGTAPRPIWIPGNYAFDQFTYPSMPNATVTAEVNAVSAAMSCHQLRYSLLNSTFQYNHFAADPNDLQAAGCNHPLTVLIDGRKRLLAWLNITQRSDQEHDVQILETYLNTIPGPRADVRGLICSPQFTNQRVSVSVNSTNSEMTAFSAISEPQPLDLKTSTGTLWIYLQNPLDSETQKLFGLAQVNGGPCDPTTKPVANVPNITGAVSELIYDNHQADPFIQMIMSDRPESGDPIDLDVLEAKVADFAGKIQISGNGWSQSA
ncbi:hypothetical protein BDW59DRAFT_166302 [Aspergillus cavernicola]|uniref:Uncharacterized protein n=1 Tax=Aspergillus cavernicola TaxID=176166 RepID=A0ABR4HM63_9EURO